MGKVLAYLATAGIAAWGVSQAPPTRLAVVAGPGFAMATVLAYVEPVPGRLYPLVPTLQELQRRGHRVAVRTGAAFRSTGGASAPADALEHLMGVQPQAHAMPEGGPR